MKWERPEYQLQHKKKQNVKHSKEQEMNSNKKGK
jgi:hypothetical protein